MSNIIKRKIVFSDIEDLMSCCLLNGVVDLYGISLTNEQLNNLYSYCKNIGSYRVIVRKIDTSEMFLVNNIEESNLKG